MSEDIQSPPYPGDGVNDDGLFNLLKELRDWALVYRNDLNAKVGQEVIPQVRKPPARAAYTVLSVPIKYGHYQFLRLVREQWDELVRLYEGAWDCKNCVQARAFLCQTVANFLNGAFVPYEQREAHKQRGSERLSRMYDALMAVFAQTGVKPPPKEG